MQAVATLASTVTCGHAGTAATVGAPKLTVGGSRVLVASGVVGALVAHCGTLSSSTSAPCLTVLSITGAASLATKLNVGGNPVVLASLAGTTDGKVGGLTPQYLLSAIVPQTMLMAT